MSLGVSVILSQLNGEAFLAQALESLAAQSLVPEEVLLIDGGSTDRSLEIASRFPFVRILPQAGRGIPDANNQGIFAARGPLVAFLEHDDLWHPRKLELQYARFAEAPTIDYCVTRFRFFRQPGAEIPSCFKPELFEGTHVGRILSTLMARKRFFERIGGFDASYVSAGDVDWFARAQDVGGRLAILDRDLVRKRIHGSNFSNQAEMNNAEMLRALHHSIFRKAKGRLEAPPTSSGPLHPSWKAADSE